MNDALMTILLMSLTGSVLAIVLFLLKPIIRNHVSKAFLYYIWLPVLVRLIVPFGFAVNVAYETPLMPSIAPVSAEPVEPAINIPIPENAVPVLPGDTGGPFTVTVTLPEMQTPSSVETTPTTVTETDAAPKAEEKFDFVQFLLDSLGYIWLAGAVVSFGWYLISYAVFYRRLSRSFASPSMTDLEVFNSMRRTGKVCLVTSVATQTPMHMGAFYPVIVLPQIDYTASGMEKELRDVLRHELTHWRRHDIFYKWFTVLVQSVHWFNPFVYFIRREIDKSCELSCDEAVVRGLSEQERISYGNTLLALASEHTIPKRITATTLSEGKKQLKERIVSIRDYKKSTRTMVALMLIVAIVLTGCATAIASVGADTADFQKAETSPISDWLYRDDAVLAYIMEHYDIDGKKITGGEYQNTASEDGQDFKLYKVDTEDGGLYWLTAYGELKAHKFLFRDTGQRGPEFRVKGISFFAEPETGASAGGVERMATLKAVDIKSIETNSFHKPTAEEFAPAINAAAEHLIRYWDVYENDYETWLFWEAEIWLSGGPDVFDSSKDEHLVLRAGLEEDVVVAYYHNGLGGDNQKYFLRDKNLYWLIRNLYNYDGVIDAEAYALYGAILEARAQEDVENSHDMDGKPFASYQIIQFEKADTFYLSDGAIFDVYLWDVAFLTDNPTKVAWAGGMMLDGVLRVRAYEQYTYFVVNGASAEADYRFLPYDIYYGPDEETGRENAWYQIKRTFGVGEAVIVDYMGYQTARRVDSDLVAVLLRPTRCTDIDGWGYYIPENQDAWKAAWDEAVSHAGPMDRVTDSSGLCVERNEVFYTLSGNGDLEGRDRVAAADAKALNDLLQEVRYMFDLDPVYPKQLRGIRSATLRLNGNEYVLTDPAFLAQIETLLTNATDYYGMSSCWYTSLLTLELENGESKMISIATDSCGMYLSDGLCFRFANGNEEFYGYFGINLEDIL